MGVDCYAFQELHPICQPQLLGLWLGLVLCEYSKFRI